MIKYIRQIIILILISSCSYQGYKGVGKVSVHTFRLIDREIEVIGFDPTAGRMVTKTTYDPAATYGVLCRIQDTKLRNTGSSGLSGGVEFEMIVQETIEASPYRKGDIINIYGGLDGSTYWIKKGGYVDVIFENRSNKIIDIIKSEK